MIEIKSLQNEYDAMVNKINNATNGKSVAYNRVDDLFNEIDEVVLHQVNGVDYDNKKNVNLYFLIGRVVSEIDESGMFDLEATLTLQIRDSDDGIISEEDWTPCTLTEDEALTQCFNPFMEILNQYQ